MTKLVHDAPLKLAEKLPKPQQGQRVISNLPLDLLPQWLEVNDLRGQVEVSIEWGGPLIVKRRPQVES